MKFYSVHGPFKIKRQDNGHIDRSKEAIQAFWKVVDDDVDGLSKACGCYLFAVRAGKGIRPWYVGQAQKQTFEDECFALHKREIYNEVLVRRKGTAILFLIAKTTTTGRFAKPSKNKSRTNGFLESMLIGSALEKNGELMNIHKTAVLRDLSVPSLVNSRRSRPTTDEQTFRRALD